MGVVGRGFVNDFSVYAGYIGFTRDGATDTYSDPLAQNVNQPGAAEGPGFRHQTYEPVPIGYAITAPDDDTRLQLVARLGGRSDRVGAARRPHRRHDDRRPGDARRDRGSARAWSASSARCCRCRPSSTTTRSGSRTTRSPTAATRCSRTRSSGSGRCPTSASRRPTSRSRAKRDKTTITATVRNLGVARCRRGVPVRFTDNGNLIGQADDRLDRGGRLRDGLGRLVDEEDQRRANDRRHGRPARRDRRERRVEQLGDPRRDGQGQQGPERRLRGRRRTTTTRPTTGRAPARRATTATRRAPAPGGSWTSAPIAVDAGRSYELALRRHRSRDGRRRSSFRRRARCSLRHRSHRR